jgi:hypothetical protein
VRRVPPDRLVVVVGIGQLEAEAGSTDVFIVFGRRHARQVRTNPGLVGRILKRLSKS